MKPLAFLPALLIGCAKSEPPVPAPGTPSVTPAEVVAPFYDLLSNPGASDMDARTRAMMADDWVSLPTPPGGPGREGFVNTMAAFAQVVPDLEWSIVETLTFGDTVFVRGRASATPQGPFFGVEPPTGRSFEIMSQDLHVVKDGKLASVYHYEDWTGAIAQLQGQEPSLDEDAGSATWDVAPADAKAIVKRFYEALSNPTSPTLDADTAEFVADDWHSTPTPPGGDGQQGFVASLGIFGSIIPDLTWVQEETLVSGNRVVVRGVATGTPQAEFLGVPPTGKSFEIGSLDVHTLKDGKIVRTFHLEDWTTAIAQLTTE